MSRLNRSPVDPDVGQRAAVLVDGVLAGSVSRYTTWPPRSVLACAEASRPALHRLAWVHHLRGVHADRPDFQALTIGVHVDGVTVNDFGHRERPLNPLWHRRIRLGGDG